MESSSEVNPVDSTGELNYEALYKELAQQVSKRKERERAYNQKYYHNNRERLIQAKVKYFREHYHKISQTEKYKEMVKRFNYMHYHGQDEETKKAMNRKYYLAKRAKLMEQRRLEQEEQEKSQKEEQQQDRKQEVKKRGRPRKATWYNA